MSYTPSLGGHSLLSLKWKENSDKNFDIDMINSLRKCRIHLSKIFIQLFNLVNDTSLIRLFPKITQNYTFSEN